ncbi:MAG: hypothetical protein ABIO17_05725 [Pseudoxanthomonas sp.]
MRSLTVGLSLALATTAIAPMAVAETLDSKVLQRTVLGGATMFPAGNIIRNAINAKDHTTLVAAIETKRLVINLECRRPLPSWSASMKPSPRRPPPLSKTCSSQRTKVRRPRS